MNRLTEFKEVVFLKKDIFPSDVQESEGVIYVSDSIEFISFKCPCGCGKKNVLPLTSWGWDYIITDDKITISPDINESLEIDELRICNSHYEIINNEVIWILGGTKMSLIQ